MPALSTPPAPSATQGGPGPQGPPGANAFTYSTADVVNYNGVSNLTIPVQNVTWVAATAPVFIPHVGTFSVTSVDTTNKTLTLLPLKTDVGTYPYTIPSGTLVSSSGFPGLNGATGTTGMQGPIGPQGPPGPQGLQGPQGQAGIAGATGPQGPLGSQGATGPTGPTGSTGPQGPQGPPGIKGDQGPGGMQGIQGPPGPQGPEGVTGPSGPTGAQGPPGPAVTAQGYWNPSTVYAQGDLVTYNNLIYIALRASQNAQPDNHPSDWAVYSSVGIQGPQGPPGAIGAPGAQGPQGVPGPQGPSGADGATGATGPVGPPGPLGSTGPQGPQGPVGATGPVGPTGPQGVPGTGAVWRGNWNSAATYNANDAVSYNGSSYVAMANNLNKPPDTNPSLWQLIAQKGDTGAVGPQGPQGTAGTPGSTGPQGPPGPTAVSADANNTATLGSDSKIYVPLATMSLPGGVNHLSGNQTDYLDGTNTFRALAPAVQPTIWSARLRSFNAVGNQTFEVDQRNVGNSFTIAAPGTTSIDRWILQKSGTLTATGQQMAGNVIIPGTNFTISRSFLRVTLTSQEASLAAGDFLYVLQIVEGPMLRELVSDVHSWQVLVRSSVAGLVFGVCLRSSSGTIYSLTNTLTIPTANTWTVLTLPNLPVWTPSATWTLNPGNQGYQIYICLAGGSSNLSSSNGSWVSGSFFGAAGQGNFAASPVNSTFDIAFIQHEPGSQCTTLIDKPFTQNLDECLRYFCKSYDYDVAIGTVTNAGYISGSGITPANTSTPIPFRYPKPMAKIPTVTMYSPNNGAANTCYNGSTATNVSISGFGAIGKTAAGYFAVTATPSAANQMYVFHATADTGW